MAPLALCVRRARLDWRACGALCLHQLPPTPVPALHLLLLPFLFQLLVLVLVLVLLLVQLLLLLLLLLLLTLTLLLTLELWQMQLPPPTIPFEAPSVLNSSSPIPTLRSSMLLVVFPRSAGPLVILKVIRTLNDHQRRHHPAHSALPFPFPCPCSAHCSGCRWQRCPQSGNEIGRVLRYVRVHPEYVLVQRWVEVA
jgi:hypothetical protein